MEFKESIINNKHEVKEAKKELFEFFNFLENISSLESLPMQEKMVREAIIKELSKMKIAGKVDDIGNLWVKSDYPEKDILLCAHMDKIGLANKTHIDGEHVVGRLDDALGIGLILNAQKKGFRPSVLFTVSEEYGFYGSQYASEQILKSAQRPKIIIVIDVSGLKKCEDGPIIYTSSGNINFSEKAINSLQNILEKEKIKANFIPGNLNDSMVLASKIPGQDVITLQVHVDNIHSAQEKAHIKDIKKTEKALEAILKYF